ncbi:MAG TPA: immunoglobulin domain-containing protein [Candidatus Limnocylindrales bacterium]|nr:immunoglobulin domain-containing protein [Candidatus Limnocylindrales bacterium]
MRRWLIVFGLLYVSGCVAFAQIRVGAGESWSYQFTSLPSLGIEVGVGGIGIPAGGAYVTLSDVDPGSHYTFSLYENSLSDTPIWVSDSLTYPNDQGISAGGNFIWQDLQGWAQLQVISGAVTIDGIQFDARTPIDHSTTTHYEGIIPLAPPTIQSSPLTQTVEVGTPADLWVRATGYPLVYLWYLNNTNLISRNTNHLQLTNLQFSQSGAYSVVVTNAFGAVTSSPAMLNVISAVKRTAVPAISVMGETGSSLNVECTDSPGSSSSWRALDTMTLTLLPQYWFDLSTPLPPQRFYRVWQTATPRVLPSFKRISMVPAITVTGNIGDSVRLDYINAIGPTNAWATLNTLTLTNTSQLYFDVTTPGQPKRLYRLVQIP